MRVIVLVCRTAVWAALVEVRVKGSERRRHQRPRCRVLAVGVQSCVAQVWHSQRRGLVQWHCGCCC